MSELRTTTEAFATGAPLGSVMVPVIVARPVWPKPTDAHNKGKNRDTSETRLIISSPFFEFPSGRIEAERSPGMNEYSNSPVYPRRLPARISAQLSFFITLLLRSVEEGGLFFYHSFLRSVEEGASSCRGLAGNSGFCDLFLRKALIT